MKVTPQVPALDGMTPMGFTPVNDEVSNLIELAAEFVNDEVSNLIDSIRLIELATELDKGEDMDIDWVKYQGNMLRRVAHILEQYQTLSKKPARTL